MLKTPIVELKVSGNSIVVYIRNAHDDWMVVGNGVYNISVLVWVNIDERG